MADVLNITICEDGTIKIETSKVSAANHVSAENFLKGVEEMSGTKQKRTRKREGIAHVHAHEHVHVGQD